MRLPLTAAVPAIAVLTLSGCGIFSSGSGPAPASSSSAGYPASGGAANGAAANGAAANGAGASAAGMTGAHDMVLRAVRTSAGIVLATSGGMTLYYYTGDRPGSGTSACTGSCATAWPPLAAPVRIASGIRLAGPVGTITRANGARQVTIDGYPIYRYSGDTMPGQVNGNGVGGVWHIVHIHLAGQGMSAASSSQGRGGLMQARNTPVGWVLANPHGMTVYYFTLDKPGSGVSACTGQCAANWPPVVWPVRVPAGLMLAGPVGYITLPDGVRQVTIDGYPIYRYAGDMAPGQVNGNGVGGKWHVIRVAPANQHW